jgi:excisionase family DNA binding protein
MLRTEAPVATRLSRALAHPRRISIELGEAQPVVGYHAFRPAEPAEILTAAEAAAMLGVEEAAVLELAESGELPGRRIADAWRFSRRALLDWLGAS